jgi:hypothetical protein
MFRALNLAIQLNYWVLAGKKVCMLIDDIGEGLDFDRSTRLIRHLVASTRKHDSQLIMTTNDRFAINGIKLEYLGVLERRGTSVRIINDSVAPEAFSRFSKVGLNNFDFFARHLYKTGKSNKREI